MGLLTRATTLAGALAMGVLLVACGSSVADADLREPVRTTTAPPTPFCTAAQSNLDAIRPLNGLVARGSVPPDQLADTVDAVRRAGVEMVDTAPDEIRTDVERTVQALDLQLDVLVTHGGDTMAMTRDPQLTARLNSPEFAGAGDRVRAYVARTCTATTPGRW